jgi:hypothetical protein
VEFDPIPAVTEVQHARSRPRLLPCDPAPPLAFIVQGATEELRSALMEINRAAAAHVAEPEMGNWRLTIFAAGSGRQRSLVGAKRPSFAAAATRGWAAVRLARSYSASRRPKRRDQQTSGPVTMEIGCKLRWWTDQKWDAVTALEPPAQ